MITSRVLTLIVFSVCLLRGLQAQRTQGLYTIVAPGTMRSYSNYKVSVSLDNYTKPWTVKLTLEASSRRILIEEIVEVEPRTTKLVTFPLPKLYPGTATLTASGIKGIIHEDKDNVHVEGRHYTVHMQSNKEIYMPGDLVLFRAIFIDRYTRPARINEIIDICISDGHDNLIRKFSDVKLVQGVFKDVFQLSNQPVLGTWHIEVNVDGDKVNTHTFEVDRYILPIFAVKINTTENVAVQEGEVAVYVQSNYIYGQPVVGRLTINATCLFTRHSKIIRKDFNGSTAIHLNFDRDFKITNKNWLPDEMFPASFPDYSIATVTATVTEPITGQSYSANSEIRIYKNPYKVEIKAPKTFKTNDFVNITITIRDLQNNQINGIKRSINITLKCNDNNVQYGEHSVNVNENGVGMVTLQLPNDENCLGFEVRAHEYNYSYPVTMRRKSLKGLVLDVLTESVEVGKELLIRLSSENPINYFIYEIISRGEIIKAQRINVPENETTYLMNITVTYSMQPKITIFVHNIKNSTLVSNLRTIYIKPAFQNSINITAENEVLPGSLVSLNVTTDEGSYVGLIGIDERILLQTDYKPTLTEYRIYDVWPGEESPLIKFSNHIIRRVGRKNSKQRITSTPDMSTRKLFSDSCFFLDFERTPIGGLKLRETIPDGITNYVITGFSIHPDTGLAVTQVDTKLKVFQRFFISLDMPSVVKEGEIIEIPACVSNFMSQDLLTSVTMSNHQEDFEILDNPSSASTIQHNQTFSKTVSTNHKEKFVFLIRFRKSGRYSVSVNATSHMASDTVKKILTVEPDGFPYSISKTSVVYLSQDIQERDIQILLDIPETVIRNSERVQLSVIGDMLGPVRRSLQKLVRVPFGNSESNMRYFVSNLLVLKYLKAMNQPNPSLASKAKYYLKLSYATQLNFQHLDGSFSLDERNGKRTGDTWLTAYTVWALKQAVDYIQMDSKVVVRGLNYLRSKQAESGVFSSGKDVEEDIFLTAFAILAFLVEEKSENQYQDVITKGLRYLYSMLDVPKQPRFSAISVYALVLGKHEKSEELLNKLSSHDDLKDLQWTNTDTLQSNLETTTYYIMGLLESKQISVGKVYPMIRSLVLVGPPGHALALEAIIKLAHNIDLCTNELKINFNDTQGGYGEFSINSTNEQILQQVKLKGSSRRINLRAMGKGVAIVNVNYRFYMNPDNESTSNYPTNVTVKELTDKIFVLNICVAIKLQQSESNGARAIMKVKLQSGFNVYESSLQRIKEINARVEFIELNDGNHSFQVYFKNIPQSGTCIQFICTRTVVVYDPKPISVVVYRAPHL